MSDFTASFRLAGDIDGWMTEAQGRLLHDSASALEPGAIAVEIGSHHGKSTVVLARALPAGARLVAVDPFADERWGGGSDALAVFEANLERAGIADRVELQRGYSTDIARGWSADRPIRLLYIDGAHDYGSAADDIVLWRPWLAHDAVVMVHDAFSSLGVTQAVVRHLGFDRDFAYDRAAGSLVRFTRSAPSLASRLRLLSRMGYFGRNVAVKGALRLQRPGIARALGHRGSHAPY